MSQPKVFELFIAVIGLAVFVISAWKLASWLARRGHAIRPVSQMDYWMTKIERTAAEKRRTMKVTDKD